MESSVVFNLSIKIKHSGQEHLGIYVDSRQWRKHRSDIIRLALNFLSGETKDNFLQYFLGFFILTSIISSQAGKKHLFCYIAKP